MGFLWFGKKEEAKTHRFNDEDRDLALEIRQINKEKRIYEAKIQMLAAKAEYEDLYQDLYGSDEEESNTPENQLMNLIQTAIQNKAVSPALGDNISHTPPPIGGDTAINLKESVSKYWNTLNFAQKSYIKMIKDDKLKEVLRTNLPPTDENTLNMLVQEIRTIQ